MQSNLELDSGSEVQQCLYYTGNYHNWKNWIPTGEINAVYPSL